MSFIDLVLLQIYPYEMTLAYNHDFDKSVLSNTNNLKC
jgi:hypothetical protein